MGKKLRHPDSPSRIGLQRLAGRLRTFRSVLLRARRESPQPAAATVHALRAASRRAESALWGLRDRVDARHYRSLRKTLRATRRGAGQARDLDVVAQRLDSPSNEQLTKLRRRRGESLEAIDFRTAIATCAAALRALVPGRPTASPRAPELFAREAADAIARAARRVEDASDARSIEELHQLRRRCKRLRFVIEFFLPALPPAKAERQLRRLRRVLDALGAMCDAEALARETREHPRQRAAHKRRLRDAKAKARKTWKAYLRSGGLDHAAALAPAA